MIVKNRITLLCSILILLSTVARADITIDFKGNLLIPDCKINNNNPVEVDFGDVEIQTIDTVNIAYHERDFDIPVDCPYTKGVPKLTVTSTTPHNKSQGVIQTSKYNEGLIIFLRSKGGQQPLPLNSKVDITSSISGTIGNVRILTLNAAVGQFKGMQYLTPGPFTASVTVAMLYE